MFNNIFPPEKRAVCEIMWKNTVVRHGPQMIIRRKRIGCWILKTTNVHTECVILTAFPLQQRFHGRASMLRYTYVACLVESLRITYLRSKHVVLSDKYVGNSISKLQIQVATYVFQLSAGNCHR
jgi:hypothetical protein